MDRGILEQQEEASHGVMRMKSFEKGTVVTKIRESRIRRKHQGLRLHMNKTCPFGLPIGLKILEQHNKQPSLTRIVGCKIADGLSVEFSLHETSFQRLPFVVAVCSALS